MRYYIYFNRYRHPRGAIGEKELAEKYGGDPERFLKAMEQLEAVAGTEHALGHVGILRFESERELEEFLQATGEEIIGFYECRSESRPYNF